MYYIVCCSNIVTPQSCFFDIIFSSISDIVQTVHYSDQNNYFLVLFDVTIVCDTL